jgi:hypothetical protein
MPSTDEELDKRTLKVAKKCFLQQALDKRQQDRHYKLLSSCRRFVSLDPIQRLPMSHAERSRCIRWRLGWIPDGKPCPYPKHPMLSLTKNTLLLASICTDASICRSP